MNDLKIKELFNFQGRFLRSAHIERDFRDPSALEGYVVTRNIQKNLDRIMDGLDERSGRRAWRITGEYGSGKSSFALLLAHAFAGRYSELPSQIRRDLDLSQLELSGQKFLPVLITGSREPLAVAITRALAQTLSEEFDRRAKFKVLEQINAALADSGDRISDEQAIRFVLEANSELIAKRGRFTGLLIILDELGKFLEFAALHPERQDVYLLQQLAELSARSAREPLFVIGLLHQGFKAYSDLLSQSAQREWAKVAERFDELLFDQPLDQITQLIGSALSIKADLCPWGWDVRAKNAMRQAVNLGWFGSAPPLTALSVAATKLYPIHASTVPVLVKLFSRFGQNERSLFSFLLSNEPHGLQWFAQRNVSVQNCYRISDLYDYAAANFGHRLGTQSYRNHWTHIESLVKSFPANDTELAVLKTVGMLNLINSPELLPNNDAVSLAVGDGSEESERLLQAAIHRLHIEKRVLYSRGRTAGYCLWDYTSVDLDARLKEASYAVGTSAGLSSLVKERLPVRPIVARRHYIQTGNLRHFEVVYCTPNEFERVAKKAPEYADGKIVIPLCETVEQIQAAYRFAEAFTGNPDTLVAITVDPLNSLAGLVQEVERWTWIQKHTPELKDDRYASEEVTRQLVCATQTLDKRVQHYVGLKYASQASEGMPMRWFHEGKNCKISSGREFLFYLSSLCDDLYPFAPRIHNELVNRRSLSSAAAAARMRVIERMFQFGDQEYLGMDSSKKPPEMSIYLSVLLETKLHSQIDGKWTIHEPLEEGDPCRLLPSLQKIREVLEAEPDCRVSVEVLFQHLRTPPYGVREGLLPVFLAVVLLCYQREIALYEKGSFVNRVGGEEMLRLTKAPQLFELQLCKVQGIRLEVFEKLLEVLEFEPSSKSKSEILDVVRPLCVFVAELPEHTRVTKKLTPTTAAARDAILAARDPGVLLFKDLPAACGFEPFGTEVRSDLLTRRSHEFVSKLKESVDELRAAFAGLQGRLLDTVKTSFDVVDHSFPGIRFREMLAERATNLLVNITDVELKAFSMRLIDNYLSETEWIESLGSFLANVPPSRWKDEDEKLFTERLILFVERFRRVESVNFLRSREGVARSAFRVALTQRDGAEKQEVVYLSPDEEQQAEVLRSALALQIGHNKRISITAMSQLIWKLLESSI